MQTEIHTKVFIQTYYFTVQIQKPRLLEFISTVEADQYLFLVPKDSGLIFGRLISTDLIEYFFNEFPVKSLEIISENEFRLIILKDLSRWGNLI